MSYTSESDSDYSRPSSPSSCASSKIYSDVSGVVSGEKNINFIKTLYVIGFPQDTNYREIFNLFRFLSGFKSVKISKQRLGIAAYVTFKTNNDAQKAMQKIQNVPFDTQKPKDNILHSEFAHKNSYSTSPSSTCSIASSVSSEGNQSIAGETKSVIPCSTLFVVNIPVDIPEESVKELFGVQKGFSKIRIRKTKRNDGWVVFVDFRDVQSACNAKASLTGFYFNLNHMMLGGLRIEYAKNKMNNTTTSTTQRREYATTLPPMITKTDSPLPAFLTSITPPPPPSFGNVDYPTFYNPQPQTVQTVPPQHIPTLPSHHHHHVHHQQIHKPVMLPSMEYPTPNFSSLFSTDAPFEAFQT